MEEKERLSVIIKEKLSGLKDKDLLTIKKGLDYLNKKKAAKNKAAPRR